MEFLVGLVFGLLIGTIIGFMAFAVLLNDGMKSLGLVIGVEAYMKERKGDG